MESENITHSGSMSMLDYGGGLFEVCTERFLSLKSPLERLSTFRKKNPSILLL